MIVISDTSTITNLVAIQYLQLLPQLYGQVYIPQAVYNELVDIHPPNLQTIQIREASWLEVRKINRGELVDRLQGAARLDAGESEAIALALEVKADLLLIDERRGRAEADRLGIRIIGLLGILVEAKQKSLIIAVKPILDDLIAKAEFRVSNLLYIKILNLVSES